MSKIDWSKSTTKEKLRYVGSKGDYYSDIAQEGADCIEKLEGVVLSYEIEAAIDLNRIEELEEELEYVEARLKEVPEQNT